MAKKDGLAMIFGPAEKDEKEKSDPMADDMPEEDGGGDDGLEAACSEFLEHLGIALPKEKMMAACEALKSFVQMAGHTEPDGDEGEEEPEEPAPEAEG